MRHALIVAAAVAAISLSPAGNSQALALAYQADQLPGTDGSGKSMPLKPEQLTAEEKAVYDKLPAGGDEARKFLNARGFLRYAQLVADKKLQPERLPSLPDRSDWEGQKFFSQAERKVVDYALGLNMISMMKSDLPPKPAMVLLAPADLSADEKAVFDKLAPGSAEARRFLHTRSFLRPCQKVVDRSLDPLQMPALPEKADWDRRYFSETESKQVVDVCLAMSIMARMK